MIWKKSSGGMPNTLMSPSCTALDTLPRRASLYCPSSTWILATGICGLLSLSSSLEPSGDERVQIGRAAYITNAGLYLGDPAIHEQFRPRDIAAVVRSEKDHRLGDLVGRAEPAERHGVRHRVPALLAFA